MFYLLIIIVMDAKATAQEMTVIESLLEDIKHSSNRLDSLVDRIDVKLNWQHPVLNDAAEIWWIWVWIIGKLQDIKKSLSNTEKSLEEQIDKM